MRPRQKSGAGHGFRDGSVQTALGLFDESDDVIDFFGPVFHVAEDVERVGHVALFAEESAIGELDRLPRFIGEAATLQANFVDGTGAGRVSVCDHVGRNILNDLGEPAGDGVSSDSAELMNAGEATQNNVVLDFDVAAESGIVGKYHVVSDDTVVTDVSVGQEIAVAAHDGGVAGRSGSIDRDELAKGIAAANLEIGRLPVVFEILGALADGGVGVEFVVLSNFGRAFDCHIVVEAAAAAEFDACVDDAVGTDDKVVIQLGAGINNCGRMNLVGHVGQQICRKSVFTEPSGDDCEFEIAGGSHFAVYEAAALGVGNVAAHLEDFGLNDEGVSRHDRLAELYLIGTHEVTDLALVLGSSENHDAGDLGHGLHLEDAGHDGVSGEVSLEERLVGGDLLDAGALHVAFKADHTIDHEERVTVR